MNDGKIHALTTLYKDGDKLENFLQYANDRDVVSVAVRYCSRSIRFASDALRDDEVMLLLANTPNNFSDFDTTDGDSDDDNALVENGFSGLVGGSENNEYNEDMVDEWAVSNLKYASRRIRALKWLVMLFVKCTPLSIIYASRTLRNDVDVALCVVIANARCMKYLSVELRACADFVMSAVMCNGIVLKYASAQLCDDIEVATVAIYNCAFAYKFISDRLKRNPKIALVACDASIRPYTLYDVLKIISNCYLVRGYRMRDSMVCLRLA